MDVRSITAFSLKHKNQFWLRVSLAIAFALRVYLLNAQSLWNDEGTSIALASRSLEAIIVGAAKDIHPPLYYFLLHLWMPLAGQSEFAVRFLSVIAGTLIVALTFAIARMFFDEEAAIIAAFFSAFSPFQIYYSQETRMYIWVTLFAALSVLAMMMWLMRSDEWRVTSDEDLTAALVTRHSSRVTRTLAWLLYLGATIATLYTQYVGAFVVVAENLAFAVWLLLAWRDKRPNIRHSIFFWVAAQVVVALACAPWYLLAGNQLATWPSLSEPFDLLALLWRVLNVFSVGRSLDAATAFVIAFAFGILFLIGLRPMQEVHANFGTSVLILWVLVPVGVVYIVSLSRPAYDPKFLLLATPAFFILAARGLAWIHPGTFVHRRHPRVAWGVLRYPFFAISVLVAIGFIPPLRNYYSDPRYARDDYRAIVQFIDTNARAGDGILIDAPGQIDVVRYYHRGAQPLFLLPRMRPADPAATRAEVDEMLSRVQRLYAIYWATGQSDPQGIVETRLAENAFKARDEWHGNVRLAVYGVAPTPRGQTQTLEARVGGEITLVSYRLDAREARAGDVLTLTLNWRADQTPAARYKVFVHLLDARNRVVAQRDGEPVSDTRITPTWRAGETIADNYGIGIDPATPPGDYRIEVGMYRADSGTRLPLVARDGQAVGDHLILETIRVSK